MGNLTVGILVDHLCNKVFILIGRVFSFMSKARNLVDLSESYYKSQTDWLHKLQDALEKYVGGDKRSKSIVLNQFNKAYSLENDCIGAIQLSNTSKSIHNNY